MRRLFSAPNFYIFLWICYILQGVIGISGIISKMLLAFILLLSMFYFFKVIFFVKGKPLIFKGINMLLFMFTVYGVILIINGGNTNEVPSYEYLKAVYMSFLPIYAFYYFSIRGKIDLRILLFCLPLFLIVATFEYFYFEYVTLLETIKDEEEITNNVVYEFVALLPAVVLLRRYPLFQYLFIGYISIFLLSGVKRGAILIAVVALVWFFYQLIKNASKRELIYMLLFVLIFIISGYYVLQTMLEDNGYLMQRAEDTLEGDSSGRDSLYGIFWNFYIHQDSLLGFLFGNGGDYTWVVGGNLAHNDWLEIAVNNGLIGVIIFIYYWYTVYKTWSKTINTQAYIGIGLFFIIFFMKTLFSMSYSSLSLFSTLYIGYYLAHRNDWEYAIIRSK